MRGQVVADRVERRAHGPRVRPKIYFLADLLALQYAGIAEHAQVMRHSGARKRGGRDDLPHVEPLAALEHQQDPLPVRVAERDEDACNPPPGRGDRPRVGPFHVDITSLLVISEYPSSAPCQAAPLRY